MRQPETNVGVRDETGAGECQTLCRAEIALREDRNHSFVSNNAKLLQQKSLDNAQRTSKHITENLPWKPVDLDRDATHLHNKIKYLHEKRVSSTPFPSFWQIFLAAACLALRVAGCLSRGTGAKMPRANPRIVLLRQKTAQVWREFRVLRAVLRDSNTRTGVQQ